MSLFMKYTIRIIIQKSFSGRDRYKALLLRVIQRYGLKAITKTGITPYH
jgi:hypothetical protein